MEKLLDGFDSIMKIAEECISEFVDITRKLSFLKYREK